jgi:AsmA protein
VLQSDGKKTALKQATITGKALDAKASGSFEAGTPARFDAKVDVAKADIDAYLPPEDRKPQAKPAPAAAGTDDWSDEPYDFSALRSADGRAVVTLAKVTYRGLAIDRGRITLTMKGGIADTKFEDLALADGTVSGAATLDASDKVAKLHYRASVKNAQARPLLTAFAGNDRLSGTVNIEAEGQTRGGSEREMVKALNGKGRLQFLNGAIHGINLAATLRKAQSLGFSQEAGETQKTDFAELGGSYTITNGVVDNRDFKMLAPLIRLGGAGKVPMPPRTVDYTVEAKLVASLQGQGGKDALAGVPIPIKVTGTWAKPQYVVDWNAVFKSIAMDPSRIANLPGDLAEKAKGMGVALPGLATSGAGSLLQGLTGGGTAPAPSGSTGTGGSTAPAPSGTTEPKKPSDLIKGLFK